MSTLTICTGKLHRVYVTEACLDYRGSITIDPVLMEAANILPFQLVHINSMSNAVHWETYVIPGPRGKGDICLNGCPARLFQRGDQVIILSLEQMSREAAKTVEQKVVYVNEKNEITEVETKRAADYFTK